MSFEDSPPTPSAWDQRPVKTSEPVAADTATGAAVAPPASSASSQSTSSPVMAVDSDARQAIGELHRLITDIGQQSRAEIRELEERVRALELHATDPAGHNPPTPAAPPAPSAPPANG